MSFTFTNFIGLLYVLFTLIFRVVPIYGVVRLVKTGDIRPIPVLLYFSTLMSTTFWTVYGLQIHVWQIWVINGSAVIIMPLYLTLYLYFLPGCSVFARFLLIVLLYVFTNTLVYISFEYFSEDMNGTIASSLSFLVQTSQVFTIVQVISTNNNIYIDIILLFSFASTNVLNALYGILINRIYWWLSMLWGLNFNIILIVLYYKIDFNPNKSIVEEYDDDMSDVSYITDNASEISDNENTIQRKVAGVHIGKLFDDEEDVILNRSLENESKQETSTNNVVDSKKRN